MKPNAPDRQRKSGIIGWLLVTLLLAACQPSLTPVARATPQILTVEVTPALQSLSEVFHTCAESLENTGLVLLETPAQAIDLAQAPLALRWSADSPVKSYAAVLGQENLVMVINPKNPIQKISLADVKKIYSGSLRNWMESTPPGEIQAWAYPAGDDGQGVFESMVLGMQASPRVTSTAPNAGAMRTAVAGNVNAIGFLPGRWVDQTVKGIPIEGLNPEQLKQPILGLSKSEPTGPEKAWLLCIQARLKG